MARSRKKVSPAAAAKRIPTPPDPTPPATGSAEAAPPVLLLTAYTGGDGRIVLLKDAGRGLLVIAADTPRKSLRLGDPIRKFLRENDFVEEAKGGPWVRPIDREASFQDRIDAERVLLKIAEKLRGEGEDRRRAGRRSR